MAKQIAPGPHNKPGWRSTEFWLNMLALLVAFLTSAEVFAESSTALKSVVFVSAILSNMGYTINRTGLKRDNLKSSVLATLAAAAQMAADALGSPVARKPGIASSSESTEQELKKKATMTEIPPRIE